MEKESFNNDLQWSVIIYSVPDGPWPMALTWLDLCMCEWEAEEGEGKERKTKEKKKKKKELGEKEVLQFYIYKLPIDRSAAVTGGSNNIDIN